MATDTGNTPAAPVDQDLLADCITTLDSVIAAETRKLEALQRHRRGLTQLLTPPPSG